MDVPLEIRFHNMAPSDAIEARVRERVEKLNHLYDQLVACRVGLGGPRQRPVLPQIACAMRPSGHAHLVRVGPCCQ